MHQLKDPLLFGKTQPAALQLLCQRRGVLLLEVRLAGQQQHDAEFLEDVGLHPVCQQEIPDIENGVELEDPREESHDPIDHYDLHIDIHLNE